MFSRLKAGITRTRAGLAHSLDHILGRSRKIDPSDLEEFESVLLRADVGVAATERIIESVKNDTLDRPPSETLLEVMTSILAPCEQPTGYTAREDGPFVLLVVGVNGVGKTTTIAKIAARILDERQSVMLAAGDTFRAAAVEQLKMWGDSLSVPVIAQHPRADPASVIFDACAAADGRSIDFLIADTAGRLHTQGDLMNELVKIQRVINRQREGAPHETLLVLDATTGQNALNQVEQFASALEINALCVTKLDGTAKGGVVLALAQRFALPIRFIGIGEAAHDLQPFKARDFARALLDDSDQAH